MSKLLVKRINSLNTNDRTTCNIVDLLIFTKIYYTTVCKPLYIMNAINATKPLKSGMRMIEVFIIL